MIEKTRRQSFKSIPAKNWWELRRRFAQTLPSKVTRDYLQSVLAVDKGAAQNLLAPLRVVGLIDADGKPTQLANDWRSDEHYAEVCQLIVRSAYPQDLLDAFPEPNPDRGAVENWFMRNGRLGEAGAAKAAAFFLLLRQTDLSVQDEPGPAQRAKTGRAKRQSNGRADKPAAAGDRLPLAQLRVPEAPRHQPLPQLHIDIQVHISAEASSEQIDQVFASMAKHLYGRVSE